MYRILLMRRSHTVGKDILVVITEPQVLNLNDRIGHRISYSSRIDVPQLVGYIQLRRHKVGCDDRLTGIFGERSQQADLPAVHLLGIVAQVHCQQHGVVHRHDVHQQVGIADT